MIKILVTGAKGQLGSSIRFVSGINEDFSFDYTDVNELDICNPDSVKQYLKMTIPDYIINCAAYTNVDKAESETELCYQLNAEAVKNLKQGAGRINAKIIHISTDFVFDGRKNTPYTEEDPTDPESVYGKSKLKGESYLKDDPNAIIIRTSWMYSQFGKNFVKTIIRISQENKILRVVSDQTGTPTYAPDLAMAILSIIKFSESDGRSFIPSVYHYSNQGTTNWYEFAKEIIKLRKSNCEVVPVNTNEYPAVAPRPLYSVLNKEKISRTYSIEIPHWKYSLEKCIAYLN